MEVLMPSSTPTRIPDFYFSAPTSPRFGADDFAFDVGHDSLTPSLSAAEDLFDGGVIKPFNPPPQRNATEAAAPQHRGRDRGVVPKRRAARSLSPVREPQYLNLKALAVPPCKGPKKWRLKDFFLFRSASEGRSAGKDPLRKYTAACSSGSRRGGPVSAHELHYTVNRAVSEDLKKKTFLPYKQGILGRLAFNPAVHALSNGFGFSRKFK